LRWEEVPDAELADFPMDTFHARYETVGDLMEPIDDVFYPLESLLELAGRDEAGELAGDPWPKNFGKPRGRRSWWGTDWDAPEYS